MAVRAEPAVAAPAPGARLLIMDDDVTVARVLTRILARLGYEAETVPDGKEALRAWREARSAGRPFAAAFMDLTIPGGMGGKEAIRLLRETDPGARAIVSSGYSTDPVMSEHEAHGFQAVLSKPYSLEAVASVLARVLSREA